jgi:twitching motility two-component system response regulator PilH
MKCGPATTFRKIWRPLNDSLSRNKKTSSEEIEMAVKKVLVVDDSYPELEFLKSAVSKTGCRVLTASSGKDAVVIAKNEKPDLVLMDIVMDELDGYGACREIMNDDATKDIPVVFVSTKNQRADRLWAERQGARGMITKPYTEETILAEVQKY